MCAKIRIELNEKLYVKDPEHTHLGWKIVTESLKLIDELGFEQFTFKKLATAIESTEASIYRYFESKHKLLIYLISWYWVILDYKIGFKVNNLKDPKEKLKIAIAVIVIISRDEVYFDHIDQAALHRIFIKESSKVYLTKEVDALNKEGLYLEYKNLCNKIGGIIQEINPNYKFPNALASSLFEIAHQQIFLSKHLPMLTDIKTEEGDFNDMIAFLETIAFSTLESHQ